MAKTVLLVDDNAAIRHALCRVFGSQADFDVCGEAENGQQAPFPVADPRYSWMARYSWMLAFRET
jgi:DNA-binding NarL/FixJ family response regulator